MSQFPAGSDATPHKLLQLLQLRKPSLVRARPDRFAIDSYLEHATGTRHERGFTQLFLKGEQELIATSTQRARASGTACSTGFPIKACLSLHTPAPCFKMSHAQTRVLIQLVCRDSQCHRTMRERQTLNESMQCYLVHHGAAVPPGVDPQRPLSADGHARVEHVAATARVIYVDRLSEKPYH